MAALAQRNWLTQVLRLIPAQLHQALDAWSYRVARQRAQQRLLAGQPRKPAAPIAYKLRPWRD
ncbi:hypothetical protein [Caenimonas soli]|uniref:hypothetical protein n=1 Tax=Caenimonas soli TaxID=2735555 RepID=UPI001556E601|nr:hypothetical protein [Caenimonas soli]NPC55281.1 hypothetical protein [Caenimonas soli]